MKPSDRIHLIRDVAQALGQESWNLIDLTLRQFGLPWTDNWQGGNDRKAYVMDMISESSDVALLELGKHVGAVSELETVEAPTFWQEQKPRLFISHLSSTKKVVGALKVALESFGLAAFVAHDDIEPTREWQDEIEAALSTMDAMIAVLVPGFAESKWTDQEVGVAIGRRIPIVPLKAGLDPYGFIGKYQELQVKGKKHDAVAVEVTEILAGKPQIASKISRALVDKLKTSESWARSKSLMDLIEKCRNFSPEAVADLRAAAADNDEVGSAWGVPERIAKVVAANGG